VAAVIDVKADLSTQDMVTLAFRNPRGDTKVRVGIILWPMWWWAQVFCAVHVLPHSGCPPSLSAMPAAVPGTKTGVTLLPFRYFYIWGNLPHHHQRYATSRQSGSPLERWSAFAKLRSITNFAKIIHMLIVSRLLVYMPADILIYGYSTFTHSPCSTWLSTTLLLVTDYGELRYLRLGRVDPPACGFGIKAGLFTSWIILFWFHNRSRYVTKEGSGSLR
jgi:hypothetical protein